MDWKTMPPIGALRAFAAYAQTGSVQKAGEALNVSHAAISQQLRALEGHLGVGLLDRTGRSMVMTEHGQTLAQAVLAGFSQMSEAVGALNAVEQNRPVHISTTPMFAAAWLMSRLCWFYVDHPGTGLIISTTPKVEPLSANGIDVALRYGDGNWPDTVAEPLLQSPMVVVAAPSLVGEGEYTELSDLARFPWFQDVGLTEATNWLRRENVLSENIGGLIQVPGNLLLDGARDGQGVAVMVRAFVERDIAAGRLRVLFEQNYGSGYHIVTRPGVQRDALKLFLRWLRKERDRVVERTE